MFKVISQDVEEIFASLAQAMDYAKTVNKFVCITGNGFEVVGRFGVDSVKDGLCPDGIKYDWDKSSRIGRVKKERT